MSLRDNSSRPKQVRHVLKHFYRTAERYWDLTKDLSDWLTRWTQLQAADALDPDRPWQAEQTPLTRQAVDSGYAQWFELADRAVSEASRTGHVFPLAEPGKRIFVGLGGILVIATGSTTEHILLTSYRPVPSWSKRSRQPAGSSEIWEATAWHRVESKVPGVVARTAVRRAQRRAFIGQGAS